MAQLTFTQENLPTSEEFQLLLLEAWLSSNPLDELLELAEQLREYERRYRISSSDFYERYQRGEMGDEREIMHWAMLYSAFIIDGLLYPTGRQDSALNNRAEE